MTGENKFAFRMSMYYTVITWIPTAIIILLPNEWYYIVLKALAGFWLLGAIMNFIRHEPLIMTIGSSGVGFIINAVWFGVLLFWPPYWVQAILGFLIVTTLHTNYNILRKMQINPIPELEQIAKNTKRW